MSKILHRNSRTIEERDACGLVARFRKQNLGGAGGTYGVLRRTLESMSKLQQRGGTVQTDWGTDGDGAGVLTDIPIYICRDDLLWNGLNGALAESLALGHFFLTPGSEPGVIEAIKQILQEQELEVLYHRPVPVRPEHLGPAARDREPDIIRVGILVKKSSDISHQLFAARVEIDRRLEDVHVVSLSRNSLVYKVMGTGKTLHQYYPELHNSRYKTSLAIGHIRMSTNTEPDFRLAHPYGAMVHNGEINTIDRLISRAQELKIPLPEDPSDTMVVDRILEYLISETGCSLATAYRMVFPLVDAEIKALPEEEMKIQSRLKVPFGNLGQGPAGIIARHGDEAIIGSDALALRPVWFGETEKEYYATSERGAIGFNDNRRSPRPLAGGEFVLLDLDGSRMVPREQLIHTYRRDIEKIFPGRAKEPPRSYQKFPLPRIGVKETLAGDECYRRALGFSREDEQNLRQMAKTGSEPLGAVGYSTGALAAIKDSERMLADYCHERVAVITNPALDSEREYRPFSLNVRFGDRGGFMRPRVNPCWEFPSPIVFSSQISRLLEELRAEGVPVNRIFIGREPGETQDEALERITGELTGGTGFRVVYLQDGEILTGGRGLLDPVLVMAAVNRQLAIAGEADNTAIILESRRLRNLHDLMVVYGLGAELIIPVTIERFILSSSFSDRSDLTPENCLYNLLKALKTGMKKVISTMGIHELEGYGRVFCSLGLNRELEDLLGVDGYLGSADRGFSLERLEEIEQQREQSYNQQQKPSTKPTVRWTPELRKALDGVAAGELDYSQYEESLNRTRERSPLTVSDYFKLPDDSASSLSADNVKLDIDGSAAPIFFAAMSYGSTNVVPFTAYAEAGRQLQILVINGEGGEPEYLRQQPPPLRAQQLASGRFGVDTDLLASATEIQIKVGQGAKPGEGGLLKAAKVTPHIAETRRTPAHIDLISPANNHDFYSIEDLIPTVINELRAVNPRVRVDIKLPAIPNLAPIVTGLAKEGHPDAITISGYDGGTGAARKHAMKHVGFPVEVALNEAHRALCKNGLRDRIELRAEGGVQGVEDVLKLAVLGADRVGFGTACMLVVQCLYCGQCHTNRCPRGITSTYNSSEEAEKNGVKVFQPRVLERSIERLVQFFGGMKKQLTRRLAQLGIESFSHLQGRVDLLELIDSDKKEFELSGLLQPVEMFTPPAESDLVRDRHQTSISAEQAQTLETELRRQSDRKLDRLRFVTSLKNTDRAVGAGVSGVMARYRRNHGDPSEVINKILIRPEDPCIPGNGLGAFNESGVELVVRGGAQDGTAKSMSGGRVVILPGENNMGYRLDGSVGKSAAYGATGGTLVVAGKYADSRFGVRCSGADLIHLGELTAPVADTRSLINSRANLKGFAFEYMTSGRGLVLGDPGMDLGTGMTGGVVYVKLNPDLGLTKQALEYRLGRGVELAEFTEQDIANVVQLLDTGRKVLEFGQTDLKEQLEQLKKAPAENFCRISPVPSPMVESDLTVDPLEAITRFYESSDR